ncbi:P2X purinoceptor 7-like [Kryptolebias marmoratus]|uniref:P2X purinoceptor 7-like n=1 Tax=Kryptolebias marmoratus TaxID=37003 RepID=UPI0018AC9E94|nr:P2X purinoceptor 7-like [Kryptolebias marmoratus]XP_037834810.1 P2X purinoceptor 7-like [Kryptolebias marmoratus]XP_037836718.1 P2X purinoceptor 7-like [Kryptolebias marmoratus]
MDTGSICSSSSSSDFSEFDFESEDEAYLLVSESGLEDEEFGEGRFECDIDGIIQPYMDEPEVQPPPDDDEEEMEVHPTPEIDFNIVENWCSCGHCQVQPTQRECVCCHSVNVVSIKLEYNEDDKPTGCITDLSGFNTLCLDELVLEIAFKLYRIQYGKKAYNGPYHKKMRHTGYRQFVSWCWSFLGEHIRVVLPSCVVSKIRAFFPPPGLEENFVFTGFLD